MIALARRRTMGEEPEPNYAAMYLTFEALESGTFQFTNAVNYSLDDGTTWVALAANTATPTLSAGDKILWKATITPSTTSGSEGIGTFSSTCNYNAMGNPLSLRSGDSFKGVTTMPNNNYTFYRLFYNNDKLLNAENLSLPYTTIRAHCYRQMFYLCSNMTLGPELPAKTIPTYAYQSMFNGCTSLLEAPALPGTTMATYTYNAMFYGCTSLATAPNLPCTTLSDYCYKQMFQGCTSLTKAPNLPATGTLRVGCYHSMFRGCTSLVTAPVISATTTTGYTTEPVSSMAFMFYGCTALKTIEKIPNGNANSHTFYYTFYGCSSLESIPAFTINITKGSVAHYAFGNCTSLKSAAPITFTGSVIQYNSLQRMFDGCTNLETPPSVIPATSATSYGCCYYMFNNCTSLKSAPAIKVNSISNTNGNHFSYMFFNCSSLEWAPELHVSTIVQNSFRYMFYGCTKMKLDPNVTTLPATTLATNCYTNMFYGCSSLDVAPKLPATTLASGCYNSMFMNCTSLKTAPELPAPTLVSSCYYQMFYNCSALNYVKCLATNISATSALTNWLRNVASTGSFVKDTSMNSWPTGAAGIPSRWIIRNNMIITATYACLNSYMLWQTDALGISSTDIVDSIFINNKEIDLSELDNNGGEQSSLSDTDTVKFNLIVTTIPDFLFTSTEILSVTIPKGVTYIGESAFDSCYYLETLSIPDTVTSIGDSAFMLCEALEHVELSENIISIGDDAFNIYNLSEFTIRATTPPTLGSGVFCADTNLRIFVPYESLNAYKTAPGWSDYADIIEEISEFE